jgi:hypothetical protein
MKIKLFLLILITLFTTTLSSQEKVVGVIENDADSKPISNVHVINLNKVVGVISNKDGEFEIQAEVNDTLYFSYLGFKSIKIRVTNDLIKFKNSKVRLTELAYALEEVIVSPYQLTGYLEIDAKNVPISSSYRYSIPGLPSRGYEAGSKNPGAISKVFGAIFNPLDFLYNLFGKKTKQFRKLKLMKEDNRIRELLGTKFDRQTLTALLQVDKLDIDEILRNCSYSENFILSANDLQILEAISQCYEEYKLLNRK